MWVRVPRVRVPRVRVRVRVSLKTPRGHPCPSLVGSDAESTQLPYIVGKISQEAKLSRVRALSNATKLAVKLDG